MKLFKQNRIFKLLFLFVLPISTFFSCVLGDIMEQVFDPVQDNIIYIWEKPADVWRTVLQKQTEASWLSINTEEPLIVRIVKFILKMTVVLSVTMVIFYGVKFMVQVIKWSDLKSASAKNDIINLIIWLLIALFSITAVELIVSIPKSSMKTVWDITYDNIHSKTQKILL